MRQHIRDSVALRRQRPLVLEVRDELERMIPLGEVRLARTGVAAIARGT